MFHARNAFLLLNEQNPNTESYHEIIATTPRCSLILVPFVLEPILLPSIISKSVQYSDNALCVKISSRDTDVMCACVADKEWALQRQ